MKKQYKIQLPKGKKVTMTNVDFENGVMTVNVELVNRKEQKYEPKDGDFVCFNCGTIPTIAIFARTYFDCAIITYASLGMLSTTYKNTISYLVNNLRPATEEEKKLLIDQLSKVNKKWNPETKSIEDVRWRANDGDHYYYLLFVDTDFIVTETTDIRTYKDDERYNRGNYFKTYEAAEKAAEQIRDIFQNSKAE